MILVFKLKYEYFFKKIEDKEEFVKFDIVNEDSD